MDLGLAPAQVFLFVETLVALRTWTAFQILQGTAARALRVNLQQVLVIDIYHDDGTLPFLFI